MNITDFASLQTAVASDLHRPGDALLLAEMPRFVQLAEADMMRNLNLRQTETKITGTTTGATIALPVGLNQIERIGVMIGVIEYTLTYTSPNGIEQLSYPGYPTRFTVENGAIRLIRPPMGSYQYTIYLISQLTPLSASNPTNWLLTNAPDVYFYATLVQAAGWTRDDATTAKASAGYAAAMESVRMQDAGQRFPISGGLQIKPRGVARWR